MVGDAASSSRRSASSRCSAASFFRTKRAARGCRRRQPARPARSAGHRRHHRTRAVGAAVQPRSEHHRQDAQISRMPAPLPIVGVMPPGVRFLPDPAASSEPNYDVNAQVDYFLPFEPDETQPRARGWNVVSRLRDGVDLAQAQSEIAQLHCTSGAGRYAARRTHGLECSPCSTCSIAKAASLLLPLFGFVVLVFFVACVNVAGLFVARGLQRHREYAMRAALGASRSRLFRQTITESAALSMLSAMLGAVFAFGIVTVFKAIGDRAIPRADDVQLGWPVVAFGFVGRRCSPPSSRACFRPCAPPRPVTRTRLKGVPQHDRPRGTTVARRRSLRCRSCSP